MPCILEPEPETATCSWPTQATLHSATPSAPPRLGGATRPADRERLGHTGRHPLALLPLSAPGGIVGVLGVRVRDSAAPSVRTSAGCLSAAAGQAAIALERIRLAAEVGRARLVRERDRLQNTLLSSISHDLRTPLASILGAATSLLSDDAAHDGASRHGPAHTIREEAERLNRFVGNLLDTTRIESGALQLHRDWVDIGEIIGAAVLGSKSNSRGPTVEVCVSEGAPVAPPGLCAHGAGVRESARQRRQVLGGRKHDPNRRQPARRLHLGRGAGSGSRRPPAGPGTHL